LTPLQDAVLNLSLFVLPGSRLFSAAAVIVCYRSGASPMSYGWYLLPVVLAQSYFVYAAMLSGRE
jgi:hypothetical protein